MTGGTVAILGPVGRNFAAGMTGGVAFVADRQRTIGAKARHMDVLPLTVTEQRQLRELLEAHERLTGSRTARGILRNDPTLSAFVAVRSPEGSRSMEREALAERVVNE